MTLEDLLNFAIEEQSGVHVDTHTTIRWLKPLTWEGAAATSSVTAVMTEDP